MVRSLKGHGHWVNTLALSAEYALRTGAYDHTTTAPSNPKEAQAKALHRCALSRQCTLVARLLDAAGVLKLCTSLLM